MEEEIVFGSNDDDKLSNTAKFDRSMSLRRRFLRNMWRTPSSEYRRSSTESFSSSGPSNVRRKSSRKPSRKSSNLTGGPLGPLPQSWVSHYNSKIQPSDSGNQRAVWAGRIVFICVLFGLAVMLAFVAYLLLSEDERNLGKIQFKSLSDRALVQAKEGLLSRRWAGVTLANFAGELYPNSKEWPYVSWPGYELDVNNLISTSRGRDMGFVPFVKLSELDEFEAFASDVYNKLGFPNSTGNIPGEGFGIWARNTSVTPVQKYHDTTADTPYGSPNTILAPIFRTDEGAHPVLLFNVHSQKFTGQAIDNLLSCAEERRLEYHDSVNTTDPFNSTRPPYQCGVLTDIFWNVKLGGKWSVANFLPIYPSNNPLDVVGYIPSIFIVSELLENVFSKEITGIDAVFETNAKTVSYEIIDGVATYTGEGKLFDDKYKDLQQVSELADRGLYTTGQDEAPKSFNFTLTPNDKFFKVYKTNGPIIAAVVVFCSVFLTMIVFFVYDYFVRREFDAKQDLLNARRQFMRFVSHEVRTPLNAVYMGLDLMQSELAQVLGFDSTEMLQVIQQNNKYGSSDDLLALAKEGNDNGKVPRQSKFLDKDNTNLLTAQDNIVIAPQTAKEWFDLSQEIQGNAQGAVDVLNDLLNYDKIEQGTLQLALEPLNVWQLVEKAILEFKLPASSKHIDLQVSFDTQQANEKGIGKFTRARLLPDSIKGLRVIGDSVRLTQVLRNLMSNALKFTPADGSVHVQAMYQEDEPGTLQTIELQKGRAATGCLNGSIKVRVADTGAGMSPDQISRLFQEGIQFNVNELQAGGGSGLGLYIADGIVKQHNGTLSASSKGIGHGSTFEMALPLWRVSTDECDYCDEALVQRHLEGKLKKKQMLYSLETTGNNRKSGSDNEEEEEDTESNTRRSSSHRSSSNMSLGPNDAPMASENSSPSLRILVVDDVKSNRKLLKRLLENRGHRCDEAENGQQSVEMVKNASESGEAYNSVLLDYEMPIMDGPTAAKEIREAMKNDVNIIGITGNVLPEDVKYFRDCGANDVLAKPVKMGDLYASWVELGVYRGDPPSNT